MTDLEVVGVVQEVEPFSANTRKGVKDAFRLTVGDCVYSGFGSPGCKAGDKVAFDFYQKSDSQFRNIVDGSLQVMENAKPSALQVVLPQSAFAPAVYAEEFELAFDFALKFARSQGPELVLTPAEITAIAIYLSDLAFRERSFGRVR